MLLQGIAYQDFMAYKGHVDECLFCDMPVVKINHIEYDGHGGSYEPYHECVGCGWSPESGEAMCACGNVALDEMDVCKECL